MSKFRLSETIPFEDVSEEHMDLVMTDLVDRFREERPDIRCFDIYTRDGSFGKTIIVEQVTT